MRNARLRVAVVAGAFLVTAAHAGGTQIREHTTSNPGQFGWNVAAVGDVNKDGVQDYAVGARGASAGTYSGAGRVSVYSGLDGSFLYDVVGDGGSQFLGASISRLLDVDNDGADDFLVGAPNFQSSSSPPGYVRIVSGADGSEIRRVTGPQAGVRFGSAVAWVGDIDGDHVPEFAVGAPGVTGANPGSVRVYSGATGAELTYLGKTGTGYGDNLGNAIAALNDVDNDGVPDFAVGAPGADPTHSGKLGIGQVLIVSGKTGAVLRTLNGKAVGDRFGEALSPCGDHDNDRVMDLLVGARGVKGVGEVSIWSGKKGRRLFSVRGVTKGGMFGIGVAGLDDLDGDGRAEIAVGAEMAGAGEVVVLSPEKRRLYFLHRGAPNDICGEFFAAIGDVNGDQHVDLLLGAWGAEKATVYSLSATPVPLPAAFSRLVKLAPPKASAPAPKGTLKLTVKGSLASAVFSATGLPVAPGAYFVAWVEDAVGSGSYLSVGTLTVAANGRGALTLTAQYLPPPQFRVNSFADLSGRRVEIRSGATVVLAGTFQ
jgi:hypothetical protein